MHQFEWGLGLLVVALLLAAVARRVGAPYPALLALGGVAAALAPGAPTFTIEPDLVLALFVAPALLDTAYDASPRDLKQNWPAVTGLAIGAVLATIAAVAIVARWLVPAMPWPVAVALGAIVAPTDAIAATVVLRPLGLPHRLITLVEGEGLFNDATALLAYRVAVTTALAGAFMPETLALALLAGVIGGIILGYALARVSLLLLGRIGDLPSQIIMQFITTFLVWIVADRLGVSAVLTLVTYAMVIARVAPGRNTARQRLPSYAVWEVVVFLMNVLAFTSIGLQVRPLVRDFSFERNGRDLLFALVVFGTCIVVRLVWVSFFVFARRALARKSRAGPDTAGAIARQGVVVVWSGMRGIITIATALALPNDGVKFPFRDLVILTAFVVVIASLVLQGLTLRPLLLRLGLTDNDPVGQETAQARRRAWQAAIESLDGDTSDAAEAVRSEYRSQIAANEDDTLADSLLTSDHARLRQRAVGAARQTALAMRGSGEIGDDAFHRLEEELDAIELSAPARA